MIYKETGFRSFYHRFTAIPLKDSLKAVIKDFPGADDADCILTYGYIGEEGRLILEILAAGKRVDGKFQFADGDLSLHSYIPIDEVEEDEVYYVSDDFGQLSKSHAIKIEMLHQYVPSEDIEKTRDMDFLDGSRDQYLIDNVRVNLQKDGLEPEDRMVRITGLGEHWFIGILLEEPDQDFGYHKGEKVAFLVEETKDRKYICYSDMNPSKKLRAEDLSDGRMLEAAVHAFNTNKNQDRFIEILELLRDSYVWVPCKEGVSMLDEQQMIPDILQNGDNLFFPVFSSVEAMGEYGNNFSKIQRHMLEVFKIARSNDKKLVGIVLNAFSESFVLPEGLWNAVENMRTRIDLP